MTNYRELAIQTMGILMEVLSSTTNNPEDYKGAMLLERYAYGKAEEFVAQNQELAVAALELTPTYQGYLSALLQHTAQGQFECYEDAVRDLVNKTEDEGLKNFCLATISNLEKESA